MRALRHRTILCAGIAALCASLLSAGAHAQTLARPGWTGSGLTQEPWWRSAVFYRVRPENFQDSDGDGVGDLRGVAERLDYLQALGVDAVVLQLPFDEAGFDDLLAEASKRHIRLVIGLDRSGTEPPETLTAQARQWLSRGAAGILLPPVSAGSAASVNDGALHRSLRRLAAEYPGERVVIASTVSGVTAPYGSAPLHLGARSVRVEAPELVLSRLSLPASANERVSAVSVLTALLQPTFGDGAPLLQLSLPAQAAEAASGAFSADPSEGNARISAAVLLTQKGALLLEYGQELGEPTPARMPWTPSNTTPAPPAAPETPGVPAPIVYGPYRPYVPPPPKPVVLAPAGSAAAPEPALPDVDTLPGFSTQPPPAGLAAAPVMSVAVQERDPRSLLNLYRTLLGLHHGNATLRSGSFTLLPASEDDAVVWLRRAPAGVRTVASVIVAVNCSDRALTLSLARDFAQLHLRAGSLRSLLPGNPGSAAMTSDRLTLGPHAIFMGELTHGR